MTGDPSSPALVSRHIRCLGLFEEANAMKRSAPMSPSWNYRWSRTFFNSSTIRRYTTVVLIVGLVRLVSFLYAVAAGALSFPRAAKLFAHPPFRILLVMLTWSLIYTLLTGVRRPTLMPGTGSSEMSPSSPAS